MIGLTTVQIVSGMQGTVTVSVPVRHKAQNRGRFPKAVVFAALICGLMSSFAAA